MPPRRERRPPRRRTELSREAIAQAAIEVCDAEGLDALSMRRVATHLGVGTMSLYHYVATKDELLVLMSDAIMGELLLDEVPSGWREGFRAIALNSKAAFDRHGWMIQEMLSGNGQAGPNGMKHFEQTVSTMADLDLDRVDKLHIQSVVDEYTFGYIMREAMDTEEGADEERMELAIEEIEDYMATGEFPHSAALLGADEDLPTVVRAMFESVNSRERFESGLDIVLDGIEAYLKRKGAL